MNILIIGNGFDLAHGLPTKYEHFLKYTYAFKQFKYLHNQKMVEMYRETANDEDKKYIEYFANLYEQKNKIFEEIERLILDNVWIDYFGEIYKIQKAKRKDGWIDFESGISEVIQSLDHARCTILEKINQGKKRGRITKQQLNILEPLWGKMGIEEGSVLFQEQDIENIKVRCLKDLNRLTRCLEIYLYDYVEGCVGKNPKIKLPDVEKLNIDHILSFNYTHTYKRIYHIDQSKKIEYNYIHGEVKSDSNIENCNLILGIDEYLEGEAKNKDNEFIQFKKFYQRIYKRTGSEYVDWKEKAVQSSLAMRRIDVKPLHNIYIIGHSLDITDKDILSSLINIPNTRTTIFYHNQEALGNQINNLVKVLGEEELISKVHGTDASIVLQKQQESVWMEN